MQPEHEMGRLSNGETFGLIQGQADCSDGIERDGPHPALNSVTFIASIR
jgi:hypothetical protein